MQGYFGQQYVNDFNTLGRSFQVFVQAESSARDAITDLERLKVRSEDGRLVPLASFVNLRETAGPERTVHYNTFEALDINSKGAPFVSGDAAKAAMEEVMEQNMPPGFDYEWTELTYQQELAGNTALYVFPICVLLVILYWRLFMNRGPCRSPSF